MNISRVYRLLRLITILQSGRAMTANELADELEVSRRTVFRDLNMLEMARIPYYFDPQRKGYKISRHFFLPPVNLTVAEALAVLTLTGRMDDAENLPLLASAAQAAAKVQNVLPPTLREHVGNVLQKLSVSLGPVARQGGLDKMFHQLADAAAGHRVCRIGYDSFHEKDRIATDVHPLRLRFVGRAWYLLAHSELHGETRTFKLGRIKELTVTGRRFSPPPPEALAEPFGKAWAMIPEGRLYDVHVRFAEMVAGNVAEVQWHASQRVQWNDDGSADVFFTVDGLGEIAWWILGYGDQAEVVAPAKLRKRIVDTAVRMARTYGRKGS